MRGTKICAVYRKQNEAPAIMQTELSRAYEQSTVLIEEVVVDFDLGAGFEVVWEQHDRYRHLAQVINLRMISG